MSIDIAPTVDAATRTGAGAGTFRFRLGDTHQALLGLAAKLVLAQLAPLLAGLLVARSIAGFGGTAFSAYMIVTTINNTAFLAASGLLQSLFPIGGAALGRDDPSAFAAAMAAGRRYIVYLSAGCMMISAAIWPMLLLVGVDRDIASLAGRLGLIAAFGLPSLLYVMLYRIRASLEGRAGQVTGLYLTVAVASCAMAFAVTSFVPGDAATKVGVLVAGLVGLNAVMAFAASRANHRAPLMPTATAAVAAALRLVWQMGWPVATVILLDTLVSAASTVIVARFWPAWLPSHGTVLLWVSVGLVVPLGVSQATMQTVAVAHGRGDMQARNLAARSAVLLAAVFGVIAALAMASNPLTLGGLLLGVRPDAEAAAGFVQLMWLGGIVLTLQSIVIVGASSLRAIGMTRAPLVWAAAGYLGGGIGGSLFFSRVLGFDVLGVWFGLVAGFAVATGGVLYQVMTTFRRTPGNPVF